MQEGVKTWGEVEIVSYEDEVENTMENMMMLCGLTPFYTALYNNSAFDKLRPP